MRVIHLVAQIDELGRVFISGSPQSKEVSGLYHLLDPTDSFDRTLKSIIEINDKASGGYSPPDTKPPKHQYTR